MFSLAAVLILASFVADRLGAPPDATAAFILVLSTLCLGVSGLSLATMRMSLFQVAGHNLSVPVVVALLAVVALGLSATSGIRPPVLDPAVLLAVAAACLVHALLAAAPLSRAGGYSFGDVIHVRFGSRLIAILVTLTGLAASAAVVLVLGQRAVAGLAEATGLARTSAAALVAGLACVIALPGGARSIAAACVVALLLALAGWLLPSLSLLTEPGVARGDLVMRAADGLFGGVLPSLAGLGWVLAMLGLLTCLHVPAMLRDPVQARRAHAATVLVLIAAGVLAALVQTSLGDATARLGRLPADRLPTSLFGEDARGLVTFCDGVARSPDEVRRACALGTTGEPVPPGRLNIRHPEGGLWLSLVLRLPVAVGTVFDLALPMLLIAALALLAHLVARCIVHDVLYRLTRRTGTSSGRLALQRLVTAALLLGVTLPSLAVIRPEGPLGHLILFMLASVPWPLALLAKWPRADARAALCGLASAAMAGTAAGFGYLTGAEGFAAGALASLSAGALAAMLFPARNTAQSEESRRAAAVLSGDAPGPLVLDTSA